ncbi:MAG: hypothetical protein WCT16_01230 [Candidatus Buchananbacteria bacterium]
MNKREVTILSEDQESRFNQDIAAKIEELKSAYPDITHGEYWLSLENALRAEKFLLEKIEPLLDTPDHPRANPAYRRRINNFSNRITDYIMLHPHAGMDEVSRACNIKSKELEQIRQLQIAKHYLARCVTSVSRDSSIIINEFDEMYFFRPPKPAPGEENKYWKAEELGVPAMLSGAFVFSEGAWSRIEPDWKKKEFDETGEDFCMLTTGSSIDRKYFRGESNPLHYLGLSYFLEGIEKDIINSSRHEVVHQVDFLRSERRGVNFILTEVIAFRIDGQMDTPKNRKKSRDRFREFINDHIKGYLKKYEVADAEEDKKTVEAFLAVLDEAEKIIGFARTTSILLDSLTLMEAADKLNRAAGISYEI